MDILRQMQTLVTVVQTGSFVAAAERLDTSKAAVSRLVAELEARLGTRLLHRTTRSLSLTDAGRDYLERCRQILDDVAEADAAASASTREPRGRLRINAPLTFGNLHLAPLWGEFLRAYPQVELDITLNDRMVDVVDEGYDLAVRISRAADASTLVSRRLAGDRMVLCASPGYLAQHPPITQPEDLAQHAVMAYAWWSAGDVWTLHNGHETRAVNTRPRLRTNSGDTCRAAALADQGVIFQPAFLVGPDLHAGRLTELLPGWRGPSVDIHAVYPSRRHLAGKVRAMVDFLVAAFAQPGWQVGTRGDRRIRAA